jgi:uncharacterized protein YukJ
MRLITNSAHAREVAAVEEKANLFLPQVFMRSITMKQTNKQKLHKKKKTCLKIIFPLRLRLSLCGPEGTCK